METETTHTSIDDLITIYFTQGLEPDQLAELQEWIKATPENRIYFQQMQEVWFSTIVTDDRSCQYDKEKAFKRFLICTKKASIVKSRSLFLHRILYGTAAAILLFFVSFTSYWVGGKQIKESFSQMTVEAPLGSKTKLYLPDGTLVWLNAGSKINYSQGFGVEERKLQLIGEGYFEVTKNKKLPFEIETNEIKLQVLGTKFNFRNYPKDEEIAISLLEGKVSLKNKLKNKISYISHNQKAIMNKSNGELYISSTKKLHDAEWIDGYLFFDEELMTDIAKELERSYNVQVHFMDESLKKYRFYGNFKRKEQTIQEVLDMLSSTDRLKYEIRGKEIKLTSK